MKRWRLWIGLLSLIVTLGLFATVVSGAGPAAPPMLTGYAFSGAAWADVRYVPRGFMPGGAVMDVTWGDWTVTDAGLYAGYDVLVTPNRGSQRINNLAAWGTLTLARAATAVIVWRDDAAPPAWLAAWTPAGTVSASNAAKNWTRTWRVYTQQVDAGTLTLGGVYDPGQTGTARNTYWLLLSDTTRVTPVAGATCPAWVHDRYMATGPDGKRYPTWHPQIDTTYWCYFNHDHGSDPSLVDSTVVPLYGYTATAHGMSEPHAGFKGYAFDDTAGRRWYILHHFGTAGAGRVCTALHTLDIIVKDLASGQVVANLHTMGDFGPATANGDGPPLTPSACPRQAAQAAGSSGIREIPTVQNGQLTFYEAWRVGRMQNVLGLNLADLTFETFHGLTYCPDLTCDQLGKNPDPTRDGTERAVVVHRGFGIANPAASGTFYTDPMGLKVTGAGPSSVQQFIKPGLTALLPVALDGMHFATTDPWRGFMTPYNNPPAAPLGIEGSVHAPN